MWFHITTIVYMIIYCFLNLSLSAVILTLTPRSLIKILNSVNSTITASNTALLKHLHSIIIPLRHLSFKIPQLDSTNSMEYVL